MQGSNGNADVEEFDWEDVEVGRDGEEVRFRARDLGCAFDNSFYELSRPHSLRRASPFLLTNIKVIL